MSNKKSARAALQAVTAAQGGETDVAVMERPVEEGTTASVDTNETTATSPVAEAPKAAEKPAKVKRDIYGDIRTNEHLRKALWSTKGEIKVQITSGGKIFMATVVKSSIIAMIEGNLQDPALFKLAYDRNAKGDVVGATIMDPSAVTNE